MPYWLEPVAEAAPPNAVIVFAPDVSVAPVYVMAYPLVELVEASILLVPLAVLDEDSVPRATVDPLAAQFTPVYTQNDRVSSTEPETVIWLAVLAATTPESTGPVEPSLPE